MKLPVTVVLLLIFVASLPSSIRLADAVTCPAAECGKYSDPLTSLCRECPRGKYCLGGSAQPVNCNAGKYCSRGGMCEPYGALPGYYVPADGGAHTAPIFCGATGVYGYITISNASACKPCSAGYTTGTTSRTVNGNNELKGTYCVKCAAGFVGLTRHFNPSEPSSAVVGNGCDKATPGYYSSEPGSLTEHICPRGTYTSSKGGATKCLRPVVGWVVGKEAAGATDEDLVACGPGYSTNATEWFRAEAGTDSCDAVCRKAGNFSCVESALAALKTQDALLSAVASANLDHSCANVVYWSYGGSPMQYVPEVDATTCCEKPAADPGACCWWCGWTADTVASCSAVMHGGNMWRRLCPCRVNETYVAAPVQPGPQAEERDAAQALGASSGGSAVVGTRCQPCGVDTYKLLKSVKDDKSGEAVASPCLPCPRGYSTFGRIAQLRCWRVTLSHTVSFPSASSTLSTKEPSPSATAEVTPTLSGDTPSASPSASRSPATGTDSRHRISNTTSVSESRGMSPSSASRSLPSRSPRFSGTPSASMAETPSPSRNSSTLEATPSDPPTLASDSSSLTRGTLTLSAATPSNDSSPTAGATETRSPLDTRSTTPTVQVFSPPPPLGLSPEAQEALSSTQSVAAVGMSAAAPAAAMAVQRGLSVLALVGCPAVDPSTGKPWRKSIRKFPFTLLPGAGVGSEDGKFNRGSIVGFVALVFLVVVGSFFTEATVGATSTGLSKLYDEMTMGKERRRLMRRGRNLIRRGAGDQRDVDEEELEGENSDDEDHLQMLGRQPTAAATGVADDGDRFSDPEGEEAEELQQQQRDEEDSASEAASESASEAADEEEAEQQDEQDNNRNETNRINVTTPGGDDHDGSERDSNNSLSDRPIPPASSSKGGEVKVSRRPMMIYIVVSACIGFWASSAGLLLATLKVEDVLLGIGPFVLVFAYGIWMQLRVHRSIASDTGIFYTNAAILDHRHTSVASDKACGIRNPRATFESAAGRFCLLGSHFWSRPRGQMGVAAQELLTSFSAVLAKFRGPRSVVNFLSAPDPFRQLESLRVPLSKLRENPELASKLDFDDVLKAIDASGADAADVPERTVLDTDLASRICPHYTLIAWGVTALVGILQGIGLAFPSQCRPLAKVICFLNCAIFAVTLWLRPFAVPVRNLVTLVLEAVVAATSIVAVTVLLDNDGTALDPSAPAADSKMALAAFLQIATSGVAIVAGGVIAASSLIRFLYFKLGNCRVASPEEMLFYQKFRMTKLDAAADDDELLEELRSASSFRGGGRDRGGRAGGGAMSSNSIFSFLRGDPRPTDFVPAWEPRPLSTEERTERRQQDAEDDVLMQSLFVPEPTRRRAGAGAAAAAAAAGERSPSSVRGASRSGKSRRRGN